MRGGVTGSRPVCSGTWGGGLDVGEDVDHVSVRAAKDEAPDAPRFVGDRMDDPCPGCDRSRVDRVDVVDLWRGSSPPAPVRQNDGMSASRFSRPGAVDLSALAARAQQQRDAANRPPAAPGAAASAVDSGLVIDVTEVNFAAEVVEQSMTVPVLLVFGSTRSPASVQLSAILERLVLDFAGQFLLGRIDIDLSPQLAAAAQVPAQSAPVVLGVLKGQILPLFQGPQPEAQIRPYIDEMLRIAQANGVVGRIEVQSTPANPDVEPPEPELDPKYLPAVEAFEQGDVETARAEYRKLLDAAPADAEAKAGYVLTSVMARALAVDEASVRDAADADPADVAAQTALADVEATGGQLDLAFSRLIRAVQLTSGAERETARTRLVELFELAGPDDPRVPLARRRLASALF